MSAEDNSSAITRRGEVSRLLLRKLEVSLPDIYHLPARSPSGERQRRVLAGGDEQVHRGWLVLHKEGQLLVDGRRLDQVVVVEDQDERVRCGSNIVDQVREKQLWRGRLGGLQHGLGGLGDVRVNLLQGCDEISEEAGGGRALAGREEYRVWFAGEKCPFQRRWLALRGKPTRE